MNTELTTIDSKEYGIEPKQAESLMGNLPIVKQEREPLMVQFEEVSKMDIEDPKTAKIARELRLKISKNRTAGIMAWHKIAKEYPLRLGQFVDATKNLEISINVGMETKLEELEKYAENKEKERIQNLHNERIELLKQFMDDVSHVQLGEMEDDVWEAYLSAKEKKFNDAIAEQERLEQERIDREEAEAKAIEEQRLENERLKKEAEKREAKIIADKKLADKKLAEEKAKADAEIARLKAIQDEKDRKQKEQQNKENAERLRIQEIKDKEIEDERLARIEEVKKARLETERIEKENAEKIRVANEEKAKLEAELKAKKEDEERRFEAEQTAKIDAQIEAEKLANAPIQEKLNLWVDSFSIDVPDSEILNNDKALLIKSKFDAFKKWAKQQIEN